MERRLQEEKERAETRQKISIISNELLDIIKNNVGEYDKRHKDTLENWCKYVPLKNAVKSVWKFMASIKDMLNSNTVSA